MVDLTLFSTLGCHLCDDAKVVIQEVLSQPAFAELSVKINEVDIADDVHLLERYGERIPVVAVVDAGLAAAELQWPFDAKTFIQWWICQLK